jgi:hypothetical protein
MRTGSPGLLLPFHRTMFIRNPHIQTQYSTKCERMNSSYIDYISTDDIISYMNYTRLDKKRGYSEKADIRQVLWPSLVLMGLLVLRAMNIS